MSHDLETAAGASVGGFLTWRRKTDHDLPPGTPCANCGTPLQGPWCHACGQLGEDFHRSAVKLVMEAIEGLFHFDGRIWKTLPDLALRPGRLTRLYLDGHRAPQIPPLRLFLVVLLLVFLVGSLPHRPVVNANTGGKGGDAVATLKAMSPAERDKLKGVTGQVEVRLGGEKANAAASNWLKERLNRVIDEPDRFFMVLENWGERFAFLMLPLSTLLLAVAFPFRRDVYLFDHVIFSLHSLSFAGLLITASILAPFGMGEVLLLAAPVHLFLHLRGVYRTSVVGTLLRMSWLFFATLIGVTLIILGLLAVGLNAMG